MGYTEEGPGLRWINNLNTATFGSVVSQVCWLVGSFAFTGCAVWLMTRVDFYDAVGAADENGLRQMVLISRETMRQLGFAVAGALIAGWTGKTWAGVADSNLKRKASPDYAPVLEAKERGAVAGAAAAALIKREAAAPYPPSPTTREHPAPPPAQGGEATVNLNLGTESEIK